MRRIIFFTILLVVGAPIVIAQIQAPSGFQYNIGYGVEIHVNGTLVYASNSSAGMEQAGTQLIALEYPLTLNIIANNYSLVETPEGPGLYYFPPVVETQFITTTTTVTVTKTVDSDVSDVTVQGGGGESDSSDSSIDRVVRGSSAGIVVVALVVSVLAFLVALRR